MSLLCRQAWSRLSCLAILAGIVLVACSSGPGVAAPTVKDDAGKVLAPTLPLVEEGTKSVSLSGVFTGASLEYSAGSSDEAVATAATANGTLTITAHKAGPATITVTAKNAGGSDKYEVKVTVTAKPSGPGDTGEVAAPAKTAGARTSVVFEEGDTTETIALSSVFTGESLTFTVTSNNPTVADARITNSNRSLAITARSPGSATITVTATNAGGNIAHSISVTVLELEEETTLEPTPTTSNPSDCPSTLPRIGGKIKVTLEIIRGHPGKCTLPTNHALHPPTDAGVTVERPVTGSSKNTWTITAKEKGLHLVLISDNDAGGTAGEIFVRVPNTPPTWTRGSPEKVGLFSSNDYGTAGELVTATSVLSPGGYFEDVDDDDNIDRGGVFKYKVAYKPDELLIDTKYGFVDAMAMAPDNAGGADTVLGDDVPGGPRLVNIPITVKAVVLKPLKKDFTIQLRAFDRANDPSDNVVTWTFDPVDPQNGRYEVEQDADDGDFMPVRMGNRLDIDHTLVINSPLKFADVDTAEKLEKAGVLKVKDDHNPTGAVKCAPGEPGNWGTPTTVGTHCYTVTSRGGVVASEASTSSSVVFQLSSEERLSSPSITIEYYVWTLTSGVADNAAVNSADNADKPQRVIKYENTVRLNVHRCVNTADCPLGEAS